MKLLIDKDQLYGNSFLGRDYERKLITSAILTQKGGNILVAGDRGSGKTMLIKEAIRVAREKITFKFSSQNLTKGLTFESLVCVEVPLLPEDTSKNEVKPILLRALIHSLYQENSSLFWSRKAKRPVSYLYKLRKLKKLASFTKIVNETRLIGSGRIGAVEKILHKEEDLSNIRLELEIRNLLLQYSKKMKFVFVFDELDKFEIRNDSLTPTDFITMLKNLFTLYGAHFIFATTENYYAQIDTIIKSDPFAYQKTLIDRRVLLNQLDPADCESLIDGMVLNKKRAFLEDQDYIQLRLLMIWESELYPFDLKQVLARQITNHGGEEKLLEIDLERSKDEYAEYWEYFSSLQAVLMKTYSKFRSDKDGYYNRYLYRTLREAATKLYQATTHIEVPRRNILTLIFDDEEFKAATDKRAFHEHPHDKNNIPDIGINPNNQWKVGLYSLGKLEFELIDEALHGLLVDLDAIGCLYSVNADKDTKPMMFGGDTLKFSMTNDIPSYQDKKKERISGNITAVKDLYEKTSGLGDNPSFAENLLNIRVDYDGKIVSKSDSMQLFDSDNFFDEELIVNQSKIIDDNLAGKLFDYIKSQIKEPTSIRWGPEHSGNTPVDIEVNSNPTEIANILYSPSDERINTLLNTTSKRLIIVTDHETDRKYVRNNRLKKFVMNKNWRNFDEIKSRITEYLKERGH